MLTRLEAKLRAELGSPSPPATPPKKDDDAPKPPKADEPKPGDAPSDDRGPPVSPTP